ncbi:unnamed protein product, partial [marine sediment metagenome]
PNSDDVHFFSMSNVTALAYAPNKEGLLTLAKKDGFVWFYSTDQLDKGTLPNLGSLKMHDERRVT